MCGAQSKFLPRVAAESGALTICADCGRTYRFELHLAPVVWAEVCFELELEPRWVLGGFEDARRAAPYPGRLPRSGRFAGTDRAGAAMGLAFALVLLVACARLVFS